MSKKHIISGAGLAGSLLSVLLAKRGMKVDIFEKRNDMRTQDMSAGRSINLALSARGLEALELAGLKSAANDMMMPMKGRMIHDREGNTSLQPYNGRGQAINSISRAGLNMMLMNKAEEQENVEFHFHRGITNIDWKNNSFDYVNHRNNENEESNFDVIFGADGFASAVRTSYQMGAKRIFNYSQQFLDHGYKELEIPANMDGTHKIANDVLHIWPRGEYMMIALPNKDGSFTCTLFMPFTGEFGFDNITTKDHVKTFFEREFPDLFELTHSLLDNYFENPTSSLGTIRCYPWAHEGKGVLLGDAAHAVVPFYGQGMNASFEDVRVLTELIDKSDDNSWSEIFDEYQHLRKANADAIADLALYNYLEMRSHTANPIFQVKREVELALEEKFADFDSKYSLVTFRADVPYAQALELGDKQDELLMRVCTEAGSFENVDLEKTYRELKNL
jgi:kynurenine 3-monooxygenase